MFAKTVAGVQFDATPSEEPSAARAQYGSRTYEPPLKKHDEHLLATEVKMKPVKLFGVVPGIPAILFPPWLVAYLVIVIPCVAIIKKAFKIC